LGEAPPPHARSAAFLLIFGLRLSRTVARGAAFLPFNLPAALAAGQRHSRRRHSGAGQGTRYRGRVCSAAGARGPYRGGSGWTSHLRTVLRSKPVVELSDVGDREALLVHGANLVHVSTSQQSGHLLLVRDLVTVILLGWGLLFRRYGEFSTGADSSSITTPLPRTGGRSFRCARRRSAAKPIGHRSASSPDRR